MSDRESEAATESVAETRRGLEALLSSYLATETVGGEERDLHIAALLAAIAVLDPRPETWFAYSCVHPPSEGKEPEEVLVDLRIDGSPRDAPVVHCPLCGGAMRFQARWRADEAGYGSRGDRGQIDRSTIRFAVEDQP